MGPRCQRCRYRSQAHSGTGFGGQAISNFSDKGCREIQSTDLRHISARSLDLDLDPDHRGRELAVLLEKQGSRPPVLPTECYRRPRGKTFYATTLDQCRQSASKKTGAVSLADISLVLLTYFRSYMTDPHSNGLHTFQGLTTQNGYIAQPMNQIM